MIPPMSAPPDPSPFAGTAAWYARFRPPYAPGTLDAVVEAFALDGASRVLDLGCGPGVIAIPLSERVGEVVAVDPDAEMIAEGRRLAAAAGRRNIRWIQARAEDLPGDLGLFRAATLGQSFHWMDRDRVLELLATLIADGGGLALINPGRRRPQETWEPTARTVVERFLGVRPRHPGANPGEPEHEPALLRSRCFHRFTARELPGALTRDIASIIGCVYSTSGARRRLFGDRIGAFEIDLTAALLAASPSGDFHERIETEVLIAPRMG